MGGVDVLAFAPHPDDVELFCGGTMLVARAGGLRTAIVDMTEGERSTNGDPERRAKERDVASQLLGLCARISLRLPDCELGRAQSDRDAVVDALRELTPRIVLAPYGDRRHPDHAAAARLVREACFLAGVARHRHGPAHRPQRVCWYMQHDTFEPSVVVDIGAVWDQREQLLRTYESQVLPTQGSTPTALNDGNFLALLQARAVTYGSSVGVRFGEPLRLDRPVLWNSL